LCVENIGDGGRLGIDPAQFQKGIPLQKPQRRPWIIEAAGIENFRRSSQPCRQAASSRDAQGKWNRLILNGTSVKSTSLPLCCFELGKIHQSKWRGLSGVRGIWPMPRPSIISPQTQGDDFCHRTRPLGNGCAGSVSATCGRSRNLRASKRAATVPFLDIVGEQWRAGQAIRLFFIEDAAGFFERLDVDRGLSFDCEQR
jgi:hypothetical protein